MNDSFPPPPPGAPPGPASLNPFMFFEPAPTPGEKALYDQFVTEYIKDYNPVEACVRVGFGMTFALEYAKLFIAKPYVQRALAEHRNKPPEDEKKQEEQDKAMIISVLRECAMNGQGATRVAAARALASIRGLDVQPDKTGDALEKIAEEFRNLAKELPD